MTSLSLFPLSHLMASIPNGFISSTIATYVLKHSSLQEKGITSLTGKGWQGSLGISAYILVMQVIDFFVIYKVIPWLRRNASTPEDWRARMDSRKPSINKLLPVYALISSLALGASLYAFLSHHPTWGRPQDGLAHFAVTTVLATLLQMPIAACVAVAKGDI